MMSASDGDWPGNDGGSSGERDALLRSIIATSPDGLITIDEAGRILSFNPAAETMFGYRADEVLGNNINCLMPTPYREAHDGYLERYLKTGDRRIIASAGKFWRKRRTAMSFPLISLSAKLSSPTVGTLPALFETYRHVMPPSRA